MREGGTSYYSRKDGKKEKRRFTRAVPLHARVVALDAGFGGLGCEASAVRSARSVAGFVTSAGGRGRRTRVQSSLLGGGARLDWLREFFLP